MKIAANGINFHCAVDGAEGSPWLIFSNSLATNLSIWEPQIGTLAKSFRILRYDQRGHGKTDAPVGPYPMSILLEDVIGLMDVLKIERAHVCGISLGGATALGLAHHYSARLEKVIVCNSPCVSSEAGGKQWAERCEVAKRDGMSALVESTIARWFTPETITANPPHLARVREMIATTPVNGFVGCAAALSDHNFRKRIDKVKNPVMFLAGEKDSLVLPAVQALHKDLSGSRYETIPNAGHIANCDRPEQFAAALQSFLLQ